MTTLRVPPFTCARNPERPPIERISLALTCKTICDICNRPRSKGNHQKCSKQRQAENAKKYKE